MPNAISVDVEEYFHASNLAAVAPPRDWHRLPKRVTPSTEMLLELFEKHNVRATFFILGYVARRYPKLVQKITAAGHEVASHGYGHQLAYSQTPKQFYRDVRKAKYLLEDLSGKAVLGYRAPSFSIIAKNQWAYDELVNAGYRWDSSLYPTWHPRYGNSASPNSPFLRSWTSAENVQRELVILPLAVTENLIGGRYIRLPVAGGAYWRFFPERVIQWGLKQIDLNHRPVITYTHPWEFDSQQPYYSELPWLTRIRHYHGISSLSTRLENLLIKFKFGTIGEIVSSQFGPHFISGSEPNS